MIDFTPIKQRLAAARSGELYIEAAKRDVEALLGALEQCQREAEWMRKRLTLFAKDLDSLARQARTLAEGEE